MHPRSDHREREGVKSSGMLDAPLFRIPGLLFNELSTEDSDDTNILVELISLVLDFVDPGVYAPRFLLSSQRISSKKTITSWGSCPFVSEATTASFSMSSLISFRLLLSCCGLKPTGNTLNSATRFGLTSFVGRLPSLMILDSPITKSYLLFLGNLPLSCSILVLMKVFALRPSKSLERR